MDDTDLDTSGHATYQAKVEAALVKDYAQSKPPVKLGARAGIYAHFLLHGAAMLNERGRLGFITSNSWLDEDYGKDVQAFFLNHFKVVAILESKVEHWFEDANVNTAITLVERCDQKKARDAHPVRFVSLKKPLQEIIPFVDDEAERWYRVEEFVRFVEGFSAATTTFEDDRCRVVVRTQTELWQSGFDADKRAYGGDKWGGKYLRVPPIYAELMARGKDKLVRLDDIAELRFGIKTGADEWFYQTDEQAEARGIESCFLRPIVTDPGDRNIPGIVLKPDSANRKLLEIHGDKRELRGTRVLDWIVEGETRPFKGRGSSSSIPAQRPSCTSRERWYELPLGQPAPLLWIAVKKRRCFTLLNEARLLADCGFYDIIPKEDLEARLLCALLNSTIIALCCEVQSNAPGGTGAGMKMMVTETRRLPVLRPDGLTPRQRERLLAAFEQMCQRSMGPMYEEVKQADRVALDNVILEAMGYSKAPERDRVRNELYAAVSDLVRGRLEKAASVSAKQGSRSAVNVERMARNLLADDFTDADVKLFPADFVPPEIPGRKIAVAPGEVAVGFDLFSHSSVRVGDQVIECRTPAEAKFVGYAVASGEGEMAVPDDEAVMEAAVDAYEAHVQGLLARVDAAVASRTNDRKLAAAVRAEVVRRLRLVTRSDLVLS
jgi:hypothetical protein